METLREPLSDRERQIVRLGAKGLTDKEIADRLAVSITTVRTYWIRLRRKLGASNRAQAIAHALQEPDTCHLRDAAIRLSDTGWLGIAVLNEQSEVMEANAAYRSMMGDQPVATFARTGRSLETPRWVELPNGSRPSRRVLIAVVPLTRDGKIRAAYLVPDQFAMM